MSSTLLINVLLGCFVAHVSCIKYTRAFYGNMNKDNKKVAAENYSTLSISHTCTYYRCGTRGPVNAEEHMAKETAVMSLENSIFCRCRGWRVITKCSLFG